MLIGFSNTADSIKFKEIESCELYLHGIGLVSTWPYGLTFWAYSLAEPFDETTVTYNTAPGTTNPYWRPFAKASTEKSWSSGNAMYSSAMWLWYKNGISVDEINTLDTAMSNYRPYMLVTYRDNDVTATLSGMSPASGYVPKGSANVFSWALTRSGACLEEVKATSTIFRWRAGRSGTINTIACGTAQKVTVPAGTFTTNDIQWSVSVTLNTGETVTSDWITLSTAEAASTAKPISPSGIVIDATIANRFSWQHIISTGTPQSKADMQWSADGTTWNTLATVTGENQYYDVPANTFTSGTKYWRVRTYNPDGTASAWSDKAEFIAINAPSAPSKSSTSTTPASAPSPTASAAATTKAITTACPIRRPSRSCPRPT